METAYHQLSASSPGSIEQEIFRSASIKEFEIILEQSSGKLLSKAIKPYFHSSLAVDKLICKDVFRNAVLRGIIDIATCERWLMYRDSRNNTAQEYGENFAEETLKLLPAFITDAKALSLGSPPNIFS